MPALSYRQAGLVLSQGAAGPSLQQVRDLQRDLRRLGYLKSGIDGDFGGMTQRAVKALQHDLLNNDGLSRQHDGAAPLAMRAFNRGRISAVTGQVSQPLVECISDLLDAGFPTLPFVDDPVAENRKIVEKVRALPPAEVPTPFLMAILRQESGLRHFHEPLDAADEDKFIVVGLDTAAGPDHIITSRGYGAGQYTLFHHPPTAGEITGLMLDVGRNVQRASRELQEKFERFVNGATPGTRADDRQAEFGAGPLRRCKFDAADPRFLRDCRQCALDAGLEEVRPGLTPLFPGSGQTYQPTALRTGFTGYQGLPVRGRIGCDWPYAVRRYNGGGLDSYHYQAQVLLHLKET